MRSTSFFFPVLFTLFTCAACTESPDTEAPKTGDDAGMPVAVAPEPKTTIAFAVKLVDGQNRDQLLAGIDVCAMDKRGAVRADVTCARSDAEGKIAMELPKDSELMIRCQSDTYGPAYMTWAIGTADIDAGTFGLLTASTTELLVTLAGGKPSATQGAITVNVYEDLVLRTKRVAGAKVTIQPKVGVGPVYIGENGTPSRTLSASTEGGPAVFADIDPGEVTITIEHPTRTCTGGFGWPTPDPKSLRSRIFGGGLSNVTFVCPP